MVTIHLLTGLAGAGKALLVKNAVKYFQRKTEIVSLSTGIADTQFSGLGDQTLHQCAGI